MTEQSAALNDPGFLRALLDLVIPPGGRMPGAGDLDLWEGVAGPLRRNAAAFESLVAGLESVRAASLMRDPGGLAAVPPPEALEIVQSATSDHPALMPMLARAVMMAYYQHPAVLVALGEPARPPFPEGFELEPISQEWLALLQERAQTRASQEGQRPV